MRRIFIVLVIMAFLVLGCDMNNRGEKNMHEYKINENSTLYWLGHASFKIVSNNKTVYIDPFEINDVEKADLVLITHSHYDHCSIGDLQKIVGENTTIVAPGDCTSKFAGKVGGKLELINPRDKKNIEGFEILAVPSYNMDKQFHPAQNAWVGYIINIAGVKVYHAGDTDFIPEMSNFSVDIALLPVGGTYTMDAEEAAKACEAINPKAAIPMHYGKIVGDKQSAEEFKRLATNCEVIII